MPIDGRQYKIFHIAIKSLHTDSTMRYTVYHIMKTFKWINFNNFNIIKLFQKYMLKL